MSGRTWQISFAIAALTHVMLLCALGYIMREGSREEVRYIEVTMEELFAGPPDDQPPGGGGGGGSTADTPQKTEQTPPQAASFSKERATMQTRMPVSSGTGPAVFTASAGNTGEGGSGGGTGNGGGEGTGSGTGSGGGNGSGNGSGTGSGGGTGTGSGHGSKRNPHIIAGGRPSYPRDARAKGWEGTVRVRVLVSKDGESQEVTIAASSGYDSLDSAALRAVRGWQFSPALDDDGRPVAAWVTCPVRFNLTDAG